MAEANPKWLRLAKEAYESSTGFFDQNYRSRIEDAIKMFHSKHPRGSKYNSENYKYRSKLFRPKSRSVVRKHEATAAMAFFSNLDVVSVSPEDGTDEKQIASAIINKSLLQYRLTKTIPWFITLLGAFQDAMKTGLVCSFQYWKFKSRTIEEEQIGLDPKTLQKVRAKVKVEEIYEDEPCIDLIPIENVRFSPNATWSNIVKTSPYLILIIPMFVYKIRDMVDGEIPGMTWYPVTDSELRAAVVDQISETAGVRRGDKSTPPSNSTPPLSDYDIVPVHLNFMDTEDGRMVYYTLKDSKVLSKPVPLEDMFWHGEMPVTIGSCIIDTHNPIPEGLIDLGKQLQMETNEVSNGRLDNVKLVLNKRWFVKRNANVDTDSLNRNVPGGVTMVSNTASDGGDVREVNWQDVTSSSYQEQDRINVDYDDLTGGGLNSGSVMTNRKLNETVGGMKIMAQGSNNLTEYTIRTFVETWVEPVLYQLLLLEQHYESDNMILALAGKKANLYQKMGTNIPTDWLLQNKLSVNVNVGMGATDPDQRMQRFQGALALWTQLVPNLPADASPDEIKQELFGLSGYRDANRFFTGKQDQRIVGLQQQVQQMTQAMQKMQEQLTTEKRMEQELRRLVEKKAQLDVTQAKVGNEIASENTQIKFAKEIHNLEQKVAPFVILQKDKQKKEAKADNAA